MKTRIGELNGRPLVICSDENIIRDSELLVITDATGERIVDIKERIGEELKSIINFPKLEKPDDIPDGFTNAFRKSFQVESYKTFVQQYNGVAYNVVGILVPDVLESVGYVTTYSNEDIAVADDKDKNESVIVTGDLTMTYDYPIRIIFTPNFDGVWEERQTINKPLQVSVTLY